MGSGDLRDTETAPQADAAAASTPATPRIGPATPSADVKPGDCLGRYTVRALLGAGGMAQVFSAVDAELGRTVALKLIRPHLHSSAPRARARLLREAQALARLHHPNVVTVHDVGAEGDRVFLAMELVDGPTVSQWLRERRRGWREIREVFLAAGRGLSAAHAAGIVHRDVKPQNLLISGDRVVVVDFGLARSGAEDDFDSSSKPVDRREMLAADLTLTGERVGTPLYMAPEQLGGGAITAKVDQFSFCVALYESLLGRAPFSGRTAADLQASVAAGPPEATGIPRFLARVLERGLAADPARRYPSMEALLVDLARDPARTWRRAAAVVGVAATAGALVWLALVRAPSAEARCEATRGALAGVWDDPARAATRGHLAALDPKHGAERFDAAAGFLDGYARAWGDMAVGACRATRVAATQSDTLLDLRQRCLGRRLAELRGAASALGGAADLAALDRALANLGELTPLDGCADVAALAAAAPPPEAPAKRAAAAAIAREIGGIRLALQLGQDKGLLVRAQAAVADARPLDHPPTLAAALAALAAVALDSTQTTAAIAALRELTQVAAQAHDPEDAAFAWTHLVRALGSAGQADEALAIVPAASATMLEAGATPRRRAELLLNEASVLDRGKRGREALERLAEARRLLEADGGTAPHSPHLPLLALVTLETGDAEAVVGESDAALASARRAIELWRAAYGPDHVAEAQGWHHLGDMLNRLSRSEEAIAAYREAARIEVARLGDGPALVLTLTGLADALQGLERYDEAQPLLERALAIARSHLPPGDLALVNPLIALANGDTHMRRLDDALRLHDEVIAIYERTGAKNMNLAIALFNRGNVALVGHRWVESLEDYRRSVTLFEELRGPTAPQLMYPLEAEGKALNELHRFPEAIAALERALSIPTPGGDKLMQAAARYDLGRALVESGRDRRGGMALVRKSRADLAALGEIGQRDVAEIDEWLKRRP